MYRPFGAFPGTTPSVASRIAWGAGLVVLGMVTIPGVARADETEPEALQPPALESAILLAQAPPPGYYPPPPPGYYRGPPPPYYYAPPPPPPVYAWGYFDLGLTLGVPVLFSSNIDGQGDSGAAIGGGAGLHVNLGLKVNYLFGFGVDLSYGAYGISNGIVEGLGHADLGMIARGFRGGVGVAMIGPDLGLDVYAGHYWRIGGPWCAGFNGEAIWDSDTGDAYVMLNFEVGLEFGNR